MTFKEMLTSQAILKKGLVLLFLLNLFDVVITLTLLEIAQRYNIIAAEVNPIINYFLFLGYIPFILFKLGVSSLGCIAYWFIMKNQSGKCMKLAVGGVLVANTFYISMLSSMIIRAGIVMME